MQRCRRSEVEVLCDVPEAMLRQMGLSAHVCVDEALAPSKAASSR